MLCCKKSVKGTESLLDGTHCSHNEQAPERAYTVVFVAQPPSLFIVQADSACTVQAVLQALLHQCQLLSLVIQAFFILLLLLQQRGRLHLQGCYDWM